MIRILKKSGDDYRPEYWTGQELRKWFAAHTTKSGEVTEDVVIFDRVSIKAEGDGYSWTLSDFTLDRDMERIDPAGWDLKGYKDNPIVLWSHDTYIPAIGMMTGIKREGGDAPALVGRIVFDDDDPFAAMIHRKVEKGILSKGSVGFKPTQIEWIDDAKDPTRLIYRKQELYEFSVVNVPANPSASRRGVDTTGENDKAIYDEVLQADRKISDEPEGPDATSPEPGDETSPLDYLFEQSDNKYSLSEVLKWQSK